MSLRLELRQATGPSHIAIEANARLAMLTSGSMDFASYVDILSRYYGFFQPLENQLLAFDFALPPVSKSSELTEDLRGCGLTTEQISTLPLCSTLPLVNSRAAAIGVTYVLEGSALGGLQIAKGLARYEWATASRTSFFHSDPARVGLRWKQFVELLDATSADEWPFAVSSAVATFAALDAWMAS